ncbi:hypothetical protein B0O99DRAFT_691251 [Bisporella sp. PMI_857]|nr:hypothetical protein B0O99DRAFT_691251 [Bisporella sp. PMI_857]
MFQRLKGAIDNRIAEEQARQKAAGSPVSRTPSTSTKPGSRTASPATRPRKPKSKDYDASTKGPDPSEFESAFVIDDESAEPSRSGTPANATMAEKSATDGTSSVYDASTAGEKQAPSPATEPVEKASIELPTEVRQKLKRLEMMETKYKELLRSYRVAHGRAVSIEPFEKVLKENTPISSIGDPDALVEYLSQLNLKGEMVMDELKRVSGERDDYKKKFEEAEKQKGELLAQHSSTTGTESVTTTEKTEETSVNGPSTSVKSPVSSVLGLFSPTQKAQPSDNKDVSEEFFSYDDEIPRLQAEVKEKTAEVESLKIRVATLESDLAVSQESSSGLVESLEVATRELNESKEAAASSQGFQEKVAAQSTELTALKDKLHATEAEIGTLKEALTKHTKEADEKITQLEKAYAAERIAVKEAKESESKVMETKETVRVELNSKIKELQQFKDNDTKKIEELSKELLNLKRQAEEAATQKKEDTRQPSPAPSSLEVPGGTTVSSAAKKKNKKKKKGGATSTASAKEVVVDAAERSTESAPPTPGLGDLEAEISRLKSDIAEKDAQITKLKVQRKTEEDLREELDNVKEFLASNGQEHAEARQQIKELTAGKAKLEKRISELEVEIEAHKTSKKASEAVDGELKAQVAKYEDLQQKSATLSSDLAAAEKLATARYRTLTDLQDVLQKAQPELKSLRAENATLKSTKEELAARTSDLRRLEAREKDLKADVAIFKKQAADRDNEVKALNEKITQETNGRLQAENQSRIASRDMRKSEAEKIQIAAAGEKSAQELTKVQEEAGKLRTKVADLEEKVSKLSSEAKDLREEVQLRGSQYSSSQGLLESMRSQEAELAMQLKEKSEQVESLEEELSEVRRLLNDRTREGETMRRQLADVDDRAENKVREMRERMDAAIEERDRAEDEASTNARRRAREVDELKTKIRDHERDLKRAADDRDELAISEKEWKRRLNDLEGASEKYTQENNEIRSAMAESRDALDRSEKQHRDEQKKNTDLRRLLGEKNEQYEKLNKEFKALQQKQSRMADISSRSSLDTGRSGSPVVANGQTDFVYLKTILLQFLAQKDKKVQEALVKTVLGQLLHFDKKDQEKWIAAITAR